MQPFCLRVKLGRRGIRAMGSQREAWSRWECIGGGQHRAWRTRMNCWKVGTCVHKRQLHMWNLFQLPVVANGDRDVVTENSIVFASPLHILMALEESETFDLCSLNLHSRGIVTGAVNGTKENGFWFGSVWVYFLELLNLCCGQPHTVWLDNEWIFFLSFFFHPKSFLWLNIQIGFAALPSQWTRFHVARR